VVNHIRTLLLNARSESSNVPGEEYVDRAFRPVQLSTLLRRVRTLIFGSKPSRVDLNFRLRQIMMLLHTASLEQYVVVPDSRITYWPVVSPGLQDHRMSPLPDIITAVEKALSTDDIDELFGSDPQEPYATFKDHWQHSDLIAYKLGGLALAIAFRTEEAGAN